MKNGVVIKKVKMGAIKPYWKNPRNNDKAVEAVKKSIEEFGYNVPIILDSNEIIVAGHTRFKALQQLGVSEVDCVVKDFTEEDAKKFRIADNKTSEFADWDDENLKYELLELEDLDSMSIYFKDKELDKLLDGLMLNDEELDEIDQTGNDFDFDFDYEDGDTDYSTGSGIDNSTDPEVQEARRERMENRARELDKKAKKLEKMEQKQAEQFSVGSENTQVDYIDLVCPHCEKSFTVSMAELERKIKYKQNDTFGRG